MVIRAKRDNVGHNIVTTLSEGDNVVRFEKHVACCRGEARPLHTNYPAATTNRQPAAWALIDGNVLLPRVG